MNLDGQKPVLFYSFLYNLNQYHLVFMVSLFSFLAKIHGSLWSSSYTIVLNVEVELFL